MDDAAAPPAAPAPPPAPATPDAPASLGAPAAPDDTSPARDPAEERAGRLRLQAKVAGVMMMLFGAFFALNFGLAAYNGPKLAQTYADVPGGNLTIAFPSAPGANVTLTYLSGAPATHVRLDANGAASVMASNATFTVQVASGGATWSRDAFVPAGTSATLALDSASPHESPDRLGIPTGFYRWFWLPALAAVLLAAGGYFAFKLRAPRLALAGAFLFILGAGLMLALFDAQLLTVSFVGTAVLCFAFVYRARAEFAPLRSPSPT
jgi:hypothetical protein